MSTLSPLPKEILRSIFSFATSTTSAPPNHPGHSSSTAYVFDPTAVHQTTRSLGLATRRSLNETSRLFRTLSAEFMFDDVTLKSGNSVDEFADFLSHVNAGWWVRRLKLTFPSQWASAHHPTHAKSLVRIISQCPRLLVFEDALLTGAGGVAPIVLSALTARDSLRAIGWTGQAYPSTGDVQTLLERLPNLETLHLQGCNPSIHPSRAGPAPPTPTSVQASTLQSLTLRLAEMRGADIFPLLVTATIPSLTHLVLVGNVYFGGNIAAKTAALREFFDIHGPQLVSLDIRDDDCFEPVGPIVELLAKCTNLKEIIYPVSCTSPLCEMDKVERVGLRGVIPDLLSPTHSVDNAQVALRYLDAHLDVLLGGGLPKLNTIQLMDTAVLDGYPELKQLSPHSQIYLAAFGARCSAMDVRVIDAADVAVHFRF
ncbi:hypothetical protein FRC08_007774 [Ceratobasidium sp. 394]|nr:hypothetical protein FRC08_007774 [Ceratobasidium sp. 394]